MSECCLTIPQGQLKGCSFTTENGFKYKGYMGIPYAKPPIGKLRFRDPEPPEPWTGILDASAERSVCCQLERTFSNKYMGEEDCLFLNIFVPESAKENDKLPVMVWIHGGAFIMGSSNKAMFGPDHLIEKNVIVISINYRLNVLGFLCLNTPEVPGNAGLKDQVMALRWVQSNVKHFGGDPDNVTIFGESAGSASVQYLMMSPMAKGLFHKAIMQSGSCLNNWASHAKPEETAFELAELLGIKSIDKDDILESLRNIPAEKLVNSIYVDIMTSMKFSFYPVIEKKFSGVEPFLTVSPRDLMASGHYNKVPCITGFNSGEGLLFIAEPIIGKTDLTKVHKIEDFGITLDLILPEKIKSLETERRDKIMKKIQDFYFAEKNFLDGYVDFMSDICFFLQIDSTAKLCRRNHPVFYYRFGYNGSLNTFKSMINYPYKGAAHGDDCGFVFKHDYKQLLGPTYTHEENPKDKIIVNRLAELWSNFSKYGNPTPKIDNVLNVKWLSMTDSKTHCLDIDEDMKMITDPFGDRVKLWNEINKM